MAANPVETERRQETPEISRSLRRVAQLNSLETTMFDRRMRHLDEHQRKADARLSRDQREWEAQLDRLQGEQRHLAEGIDIPAEAVGSDMSLAGDSDSFVISYSALSVSPADTVNPYPVTMRNRGCRERTKSECADDGSPQLRLHLTSADRGFSTSKGILPPLQRSSSRAHLVPESRVSATMNRSASSSSLLLSARGSPGRASEEPWVGDPEAISSVRRPRRTRLTPRLDHTFSRTSSLKESVGGRCRSVLMRSHSLRESACSVASTSRGSSPLAYTQYPTSSLFCSLKRAPCQFIGSIDSISEDLDNIDLAAKSRRTRSLKLRGRGRRTVVLERHASTSSLRDYVGSPETRSSVWTDESKPELAIGRIRPIASCTGQLN